MATPGKDAFIAVTRFGLGPSAADLARVAADPRAVVKAELTERTPAAATPPGDDLAAITRKVLGTQAAYRAAGAALRAETAPMLAADDPKSPVEISRRDFAAARVAVLRQEISHKAEIALKTTRPLAERLTLFFANHFCVGRDKANLMSLAGHHERTIRGHATGRFRDLLGAAVLHPAMFYYLDNVASVGPNSPAGRRARRSINENLARELLELHTLGVHGGYDQADVGQLALVLSGWTGGFALDPKRPPEEQGLVAPFVPNRHEPGSKTILGKVYHEAGPAEIEAVLDDLARHPATAAHVSGKLARHFVGDDAPEGLTAVMTRAWADSDGDIAAVMGALIDADAAWTAPRVKVTPPFDFVVSAMRAFRAPFRLGEINGAMSALGYSFWQPPAPAGWPDGDMSWTGGDALLERLDWANQFAVRAARDVDRVDEAAARHLGPGLGDDLAIALRRAESGEQAVALLLLSPEWQMR